MRLFVEQLCVMDFSWLHAERGLLGDSWQVDVSLEGEPDEQGMLLDFAEVKRQVKRMIDTEFDHRLLVPKHSPGFLMDEDSIKFVLKDGSTIEHLSPLGAVKHIFDTEVSPDSVARQIERELKSLLPGNIRSIDISLKPEQITGAAYHYSHGLKQHCGNCQRIAHGHRSRILIFRNGTRDEALEAEWAERLKDSYIGNRQDLQKRFERKGREYWVFGYQAPQGEFRLTLPADRCYLLDTESTVENIALHLLGELQASHPGEAFEVRAFEGIGKGAIAQSKQ